MKKLATVMIASVFLIICGCGPSAKEKVAKRIADSTRVADSLAQVQRKADSIAKVQAEKKRIADSIAHQDSINKHLIKVHLKKDGTPDMRYKENKKHKK